MRSSFTLVFTLSIFISITGSVVGQEFVSPILQPTPKTPPPPVRVKFSVIATKKLDSLPPNFQTSRKNRQKAYSKLLEGQRYIWVMRRVSQRLSILSGARLAKKALRKAVEFDPTFSEPYTALAELEVSVSPQDINEAIKLSEISIKLNKNNFGANRLLARLYTEKSRLGQGQLNNKYTVKSIYFWKEVVRLDRRNAEAWAFLSAFYKETEQSQKRIISLRNWLSSATPLNRTFYSRVLGKDGELTSETASIKLGEALINDNRNKEALRILTGAVSDSPNNLEAVNLLSKALEKAKGNSLTPAIKALRQATFASPKNISLGRLLAQTLVRNGNFEEATKYLNNTVTNYQLSDKLTAANFQLTLSDIFAEAQFHEKAVLNYKKALSMRGISNELIKKKSDKDFAFIVIKKIIDSYNRANHLDNVPLLIEKYRPLFGKNDVSLDKEYINFLRENGKKQQALNAIRIARATAPLNYSLVRNEASVLTELNKVDEAVKLIQTLIDTKADKAVPSKIYDEYYNYLIISSLYQQANRHESAIKYAKSALIIAKGKTAIQRALIRLASATKTGGDSEKAEKILTDVIQESPNNPIALNNLGYLLLEKGGDYQKAFRLINKALQIDPKNPSYLDSIGWAYYKLGKFQEAEEYLVKASKYNPLSARIFEHLGDVYYKHGKKDQAISAWKKSLLLFSNRVDTKRLAAKLKK